MDILPQSETDSDAVSVKLELQGLQALHEISQLAIETHTPVKLEVKEVISMHTLHAALGLAFHPETIRHLGNPPVMSGCIRLMRSILDQKGGESPFDSEYGYSCFQLLVTTLDICLLERWDRLDGVLATNNNVSNFATHTTVGNATASEVINQFRIWKDGRDCDRILGWSTLTSRWKTPLLLGSEVSIVPELLWNGRKQFLRALVKDGPAACGLSGLFFLLWRYVARERSFDNPD
ncbi:unnamed protein product [Rhizoctonia solani]|uniref:Uncharacterized protein n=1 Tax=Rhizoctonia solani TaxID=456999 RepID=A0A8H3BCM1_9AGAM|nr:unnamed protein product [Rhizoctonia solani]